MLIVINKVNYIKIYLIYTYKIKKINIKKKKEP